LSALILGILHLTSDLTYLFKYDCITSFEDKTQQRNNTQTLLAKAPSYHYMLTLYFKACVLRSIISQTKQFKVLNLWLHIFSACKDTSLIIIIETDKLLRYALLTTWGQRHWSQTHFQSLVQALWSNWQLLPTN